ncbi:MAG TPA: thiamine pyrophosphate-binding protein [Nostocaceae cyanobacterium]|nr:thiamine pyrophosphate-binding protein [Nostocaceae cyanobacterium]
MSQTFTVAQYLKYRLEEQGLDRLFGVAGNYSAPLLDTILEDPASPIKITGNPNEICAGYAADAYARIKGIGAVCVTYGVGAFSLLNATAGSFVERVPVVVINGAPTFKENLNEKNARLLYSHMTENQFSDFNVFSQVTAATERIIDARQAPYQIDTAIVACITRSQPVYLEVAEDVWRAECQKPNPLKLRLFSELAPEARKSNGQARIAAQETVKLLQKLAESHSEKKLKPLLWAGIEIQRKRLQSQFRELVEKLDLTFVTSALSKSVLSEDCRAFQGTQTLTLENIEKLLEKDAAACLIGIGAWTTGKDTGNQNIGSDRTVLAAHNGVIVGSKYFANVELGDYIQCLTEELLQAECPLEAYKPENLVQISSTKNTCNQDEALTFNDFGQEINTWLQQEHNKNNCVVVADAGFPLILAQSLKIFQPNGFIAQASWLAIGYSVPAATGVKCALPEKRPIVIVGDGAFQETCQAVSDHHYLGHNTVVFVLANGIYGIEQKLVNPNPFRQPPKQYQETILNKVYPYNELHHWNYENLASIFGGQGRFVSNLDKLSQVLKEIDECPEDNFVVHIKLPKTDVPKAIISTLDHSGEDETENASWPPRQLF